MNQLFRDRRSVRIYTEERIPEADIMSCIEAGMWAPTACNKQDYRFIYLDNKESIAQFAKLGTAHFVKNCNQCILVLYDNRIDNCEYHDDVLSAGMVIQNIQLAATEKGIGCCTVANLPVKKAIRKHFKIPNYYDPMALITMGYAKKPAAEMKRKFTIEEVTHRNEFDANRDQAKYSSPFSLFVKKNLRKIYIRLPKTKLLMKMVDKFEKKFEN